MSDNEAQSLSKSLPAIPKSRPKPPPIQTGRSTSADATLHRTVKPKPRISKSSTATSKSPKRRVKKSSAVSELITIKSPTNAEVLVISTSDLTETRPQTSESQATADVEISMPDFSADADFGIRRVKPFYPSATYIDHNGKFIRSEQTAMESILRSADLDWEYKLLHLARILQINRHSSFHVIHAFYAGCCLFFLLFTPWLSPINSISLDDQTYKFLNYYSSISLTISYCVNFLVSFAAVSSIDIVLASKKTVPHHLTSRAFLIKLVIVICTFLGVISNAALVGIDQNIYYSSVDTYYGGKYGLPVWLATSQTVNAVVDDLEIWRIFNAIRGLTGVLNWILCSICVDKIRYWSIVEEPRSLSKQEMEIS